MNRKTFLGSIFGAVAVALGFQQLGRWNRRRNFAVRESEPETSRGKHAANEPEPIELNPNYRVYGVVSQDGYHIPLELLSPGLIECG